MGYFTQQQHEVIALDAENTVTIRKLAYGESQQVTSDATVFDIVTQEGALDLAKYQFGKLTKAIVKWDGPGFEGRPVTAENIQALPVEIGRAIAQAVEELNRGLTEEERKKLPTPTN